MLFCTAMRQTECGNVPSATERVWTHLLPCSALLQQHNSATLVPSGKEATIAVELQRRQQVRCKCSSMLLTKLSTNMISARWAVLWHKVLFVKPAMPQRACTVSTLTLHRLLR